MMDMIFLKVQTFVNEQRKCKSQSCAFEHGFSLIELSMVMIISGLLIIPLLQFYSIYLINEKMVVTKENIVDASRAIALSSTIRYPCPSDRSLLPSDPNYGYDVCTLPTFSFAAIPICDNTGAEQGLCKVAGLRDTSDDADTTAGNNNEFVLIGGVPLRAKASPNDKQIATGSLSRDGWGNPLTYAVSYTSARPNRSEGFTRFKNGVITVHDEWGNDTAGTDGDGQFIVFSHGDDAAGAYLRTGVHRNCNLTNVDGENCDGDSVFVQGLSHFKGSMYYDDYSYVQTDQSANLWEIAVDTVPDPAIQTTHIKTIPTGGVGINTDTPGTAPPTGVSIRLDVNGDIRADTVRAPQICEKDGTNCLALDKASSFFGDRKVSGAVINDCGTGEVISSVGGQKVSCSLANIQFTGAQVLCPVGTWVEQVLTDGKIKCTGGVVCPGGAGCL